MGGIIRNWRVGIATLFSVVLVVGAFLLARGVGSPPAAEASAETALLATIATRDSTGDGLPDWQKALYGIPLNATTTDYFNLGMTDGEAVAKGLIVPKAIADLAVATSSGAQSSDSSLPAATPGSLTDIFAKQFFTLYIQAKQANGGVELSTDQTNTLATQALNTLPALIAAAPNYKSASDLTRGRSGVEAFKAFAAGVEAVIIKNRQASDATKNELIYLQAAVDQNDSSALASLTSLAKMYRDSAVGIAALPVPPELASADAALVNALMRQSQIVSDFARVNVDPLATIAAIDQYMRLDQAFSDVFSGITSAYQTSGVSIPTGTPGALFLQAAGAYRPATTGELNAL